MRTIALKIGDVVRVTKQGGSHNYTIGKLYKVFKLEYGGFRATELGNDKFSGNYCFENCCEIVTQDEVQPLTEKENQMRTINVFKVTRIDTNPAIPTVKEVIAAGTTEDEAKIASGLYCDIAKDSDPAYVTIFCLLIKTAVPAPDKK